MSKNPLIKLKAMVKSFFCGLEDSHNSNMMRNNWQLRKYVKSKFPEIPRNIIPPEGWYKEGEIIECKLQKFEW